MVLHLHVHGGYPSYRESGCAWRQVDHSAAKLVKALKGIAFNGWADLPVPSGGTLRIRSNDTAGAFRIFGEWGAQTLGRLYPQVPVLLVPVPASSCMAPADDPKGLRLGSAIADRYALGSVVQALYWGQPMNKSAEGGTRNANALFDSLAIVDGLEPRTVVLIDDVATTGGHLRACARRLRRSGHTVAHALCAAQTVWDHPEDMWAIPSKDLELGDDVVIALGGVL